MVNTYIRTIEDAKAASLALQAMEEPSKQFTYGETTIEGWTLTELGRTSHTWPDGDWREQYTEALLDRDGCLWVHLQEDSLQEDVETGLRQRHHYDHLIPVTAGHLRSLDTENGGFRKIRTALRNLI